MKSTTAPVQEVLYLGCPVSERAAAEATLAASRLAVVWADTVAAAATDLQRSAMPVLLDLSRGAAALQNARELRNQFPAALLFAVVDPRRPDLTTEAILGGIADVFARPLLGRRVANAIQRERGYEIGTPGADHRGSHEALYCHSSAMADVAALIARAAPMRAGVLIRGEESTGRQLVARTIHNSAQAPGPFVPVDCAAFDAEQLEIQLFGHSARAQPADAARALERVTRTSQICQANSGTLYLQNIAEATTRVQL